MTATAVKKETWLDWQPEGVDPEEMTRAELVARLNAVGVEVNEGDIQFWEYHQILPRPVKRRSNKVTRGYYPRWMILTIALIRALQTMGMSLREIAPRIRMTAEDGSDILTHIHAVSEEKSPSLDQEKRERMVRAGDDILVGRAKRIARLTYLESLDSDLIEIARRYEAITGISVGTVRISFEDENGEALDAIPLRLMEPIKS